MGQPKNSHVTQHNLSVLNLPNCEHRYLLLNQSTKIKVH